MSRSTVTVCTHFFDTLPASLLRAKDVLNLAKQPERRTIYQRVGKRWS